jgi:formylglycine-generating enzyme required for sulfatase activity
MVQPFTTLAGKAPALLALLATTLVPAFADNPTTIQIPDSLVKFDLISIPAGKITLAGKEVEIKPFKLEKTEVTWDEYDIWAFRFDLTPEQQAKGVDAQSRPSRPYLPPDRGWGHKGWPAGSVAYNAAEMYCKWLSAKVGKKFRLPTEAEWEYACRAGADAGDAAKASWFRDDAEIKTHEVAKKDANAWGLYDMIGNVAEWVRGQDGKPILCGGSYKDEAQEIGPAARKKYDITWQTSDPQSPKSKWWLSDGPFAGFRVVCEE